MFDKTHVRVGAVPNGWSNDDLPELGGSTPYEQCLDEMALAGIVSTQLLHEQFIANFTMPNKPIDGEIRVVVAQGARA